MSLDAYDRRSEERDGQKVKHLRRIADATERIAAALEGPPPQQDASDPDSMGYTGHPDRPLNDDRAGEAYRAEEAYRARYGSASFFGVRS